MNGQTKNISTLLPVACLARGSGDHRGLNSGWAATPTATPTFPPAWVTVHKEGKLCLAHPPLRSERSKMEGCVAGQAWWGQYQKLKVSVRGHRSSTCPGQSLGWVCCCLYLSAWVLRAAHRPQICVGYRIIACRHNPPSSCEEFHYQSNWESGRVLSESPKKMLLLLLQHLKIQPVFYFQFNSGIIEWADVLLCLYHTPLFTERSLVLHFPSCISRFQTRPLVKLLSLEEIWLCEQTRVDWDRPLLT